MSGNADTKQDSKYFRIDKPKPTGNGYADGASKLSGNYNIQYESGAGKIPRGADADAFSKSTKKSQYSIFNDYNVISFNRGNYPLMEKDQGSTDIIYSKATAIDLINNPRGASIYMPRDFLLCARYGLPINRMITLRRFPYPAPDNIFDITSGQDDMNNGATEPDVARLVTYMDQDVNKISDILKFSYKLNWTELDAKTETVGAGNLTGDAEGIGGWMKNFAMFLDDGTLSRNRLMGPEQLDYDPTRDSNRIHGPTDSLARTWVRDVGIKSDIKFEIVFDYELRSINGVNQKMMFIDLLANILACTWNDAKFWGGSRVWVGKRPSSWMKKLSWLNATSAEQLINSATTAAKEAIKQLSTKEGALETLKKIAQNGLNLALGKLLDKVGRPSMMMMNSLLKGDPIGDWHLTIGNPLNPIMTIGNLRLTNSEISFGDRLGYDDFPTTLQVTCTLEQGLDRDRAAMESMFNQGYSRIYWTPSSVMRRKGSVVSGLGGNNTKADTFGEFDESSVMRGMQQQTEFQTGADGSFQVGVASGDVAVSEPKQPTQTWESQLDSTSSDFSALAKSIDSDTSPSKQQ